MSSLQIFKAGNWPPLNIPLFLERVAAGFPSPAQDYVEQRLDLNQLCVKRPAATYFVRVEGLSMINAGIYPDDLLVVDRSITAQSGDIVVASLNGEFTVKTLELTPLRLVPQNDDYQPILITEADDFEIFGVVTNIIRSIKRR
ncbi:LexA family protein [Tolumonas lignilytica]|uniref:LexA family protein n=1 Tax=Tolumonas lignilytica TaxID=1283284 RepID=UPI000465A276|nr:translesion error-prone DNA polymerase V autoproteolytic subunit [Tolumonas lignilytica]